jgi:Tripartite tricarboxylate transporter TctB family
MRMQIRAPKDFWSGIMFLVFAATAIMTASGYSLGRAGRMGPGYFPIMLGCALALIGVILVARSVVVSGEPVGRLHPGPLIIVALAVVVFGLAIQPLGLVISLMLVTVMACLAGRERRPLEIAALTVAMAVFSVGVFVFALRLPLPLWPSIGG